MKSVAHFGSNLARRYCEDLKERPIVALLEKSGILVGSADQTITAANADAVIASSLGVAAGAPLLCVARTIFDQDGRAVQHIRVHYRADRYRYNMKLTRVNGEARRLWTPVTEGVAQGKPVRRSKGT